MSMRTNKGEPIILIDINKNEWETYTYSKYPVGFPTAVAFKWPDSSNRKLSPKLIKWLQTDFKQLFEPNAMLWMASVASVDPKFQPYLKDLFNE